MSPDTLLADMTALGERMQTQLARIKRHNKAIAARYWRNRKNKTNKDNSDSDCDSDSDSSTPIEDLLPAPMEGRRDSLKAIQSTPYPRGQHHQLISRHTVLVFETRRLRFDLEQKERDREIMCNAKPEIAQIYRDRLRHVSPYDQVVTHAKTAFEVARHESGVCEEMFRLSGFKEDDDEEEEEEEDGEGEGVRAEMGRMLRDSHGSRLVKVQGTTT